MLGRSKKTNEPRSSSSSSGTEKLLNSIVDGTKIEGQIQCNNDFRIDGELKGSLHCKGKVVIGPTGRIEGDINCQQAVIEGSFQGVLNVSEILHVREKANINGEVTAKKLTIQAGAVFNVSCKMGGQILKGFNNKKNGSEEALNLS